MAETKFVRVIHNEKSHFIALYTGLNPEELSRLLRAAYSLPHHVVGLMDEDSGPGHGMVVPISLACRTPEMLGEHTYSLLLSEKEVDWDRSMGSFAGEHVKKEGSIGQLPQFGKSEDPGLGWKNNDMLDSRGCFPGDPANHTPGGWNNRLYGGPPGAPDVDQSVHARTRWGPNGIVSKEQGDEMEGGEGEKAAEEEKVE
ncbi:unnamed protein product, partial [Choristocarpus tenellus]